jgi:hypothetical protein
MNDDEVSRMSCGCDLIEVCPQCNPEAHAREVARRAAKGPTWLQQEAIELCRAVEAVCPAFGCHVALTGGLLYRDGERKDCDLLFYRIRQWSEIKEKRLWEALARIGLEKKSGFGWCHKATYNGKNVDCFFPESAEGEY